MSPRLRPLPRRFRRASPATPVLATDPEASTVAPRSDAGFTLVEVLVTCALAVVVLLAILQASDVFGRSVARVDRKSDTQEQARSAVREIVSQLRDSRLPAGASTPLAASPLPTRTDLVFAARVRSGGEATVPGWVRYCVTTPVAGRADVLEGRRSLATFAAPGACALGTNGAGWTYRRLVRGGTTDATRLFDYATPTCVGATCAPANADAVTKVRTVGINLSVDARRSGGAPEPFVLRTAVTLRNRAS